MFLFRVKDKGKAVVNLRKAIVALEQASDRKMVVTDVEESSVLVHLRVRKDCFKGTNTFKQEVLYILKLLLPYAKEYLECNLQVVMSINSVKRKLQLIKQTITAAVNLSICFKLITIVPRQHYFTSLLPTLL